MHTGQEFVCLSHVPRCNQPRAVGNPHSPHEPPSIELKAYPASQRQSTYLYSF